MKIQRGKGGYIHIDLSGAEAVALLEELENVRGGTRLPKLRQVCEGIRQSFALTAFMAPTTQQRAKATSKVAYLTQRTSPFEIETTAPWLKDEE